MKRVEEVMIELYVQFLKNDSLCVGRTSEGVSLKLSAQMGLLVVLISPPLLFAVESKLTSRTDTSWLAAFVVRQINYNSPSHSKKASLTTLEILQAAAIHCPKEAFHDDDRGEQHELTQNPWRSDADGDGRERKNPFFLRVWFLLGLVQMRTNARYYPENYPLF